jgi:hypothetical protein
MFATHGEQIGNWGKATITSHGEQLGNGGGLFGSSGSSGGAFKGAWAAHRPAKDAKILLILLCVEATKS